MTLKLVAKHADVWNTDVFNGDIETLNHKIGIIEDHCETVGRDSDAIEYSWDGHIVGTRDEAKLDELLNLMTPIQFEENTPTSPTSRGRTPMSTSSWARLRSARQPSSDASRPA